MILTFSVKEYNQYMGYEASRSNKNLGGKIGPLSSIKLDLLNETKLAKAEYGIPEEAKIYKGNDGIWRFQEYPFQSLEEWKNIKNKPHVIEEPTKVKVKDWKEDPSMKDAIDALYKKESYDPYHQN